MMEKRKLGRTGIEVSVVGLGTLGFARDKTGQEESVRIVRRALDLGVNLIDTALVYEKGEAERAVGKGISGRRDDAVILSRAVARDPSDVSKMLDQSLNNLGVDMIDIYQVHDLSQENDITAFDALMDAMDKARETGKVRFVGVSSHAQTESVLNMIASGRVDVITIGYNIAMAQRQVADGEDMSRTESEVLPAAHKAGVGVTVMKPLGGGVLVRDLGQGKPPDPMKSIRFVVENPCVDSVVPGVGSLEQLEQNLGAGDPANALTADDISELKDRTKRWGTDFCRQCGYCMPCPENIGIPGMMRMHMATRLEKDLSSIRESYRGIKTKADACVECGECREKCPFDLPIPERLKELHALLGDG